MRSIIIFQTFYRKIIGRELLKIVSPFVPRSEKIQVLTNPLIDTIQSIEIEELDYNKFLSFINGMAEGSWISFTPTSDGTQIETPQYTCVSPNIYIEPYDEIRLEANIEHVELSLTIESVTDTFFIDSSGIGLLLKNQFQLGDADITTEKEFFIQNPLAWMPLRTPFGFKNTIEIEYPEIKYTITIMDPLSYKYSHNKGALYIGCDISLYGGLGAGVGTHIEGYFNNPAYMDLNDYVVDASSCLLNIDAVPEELPNDRIDNVIDEFQCLVNTSVDKAGVGIGVHIEGGVGGGDSACIVEIKGSGHLEGGLSEKLEAPIEHASEIYDHKNNLAAFLAHYNYLLLEIGQIPKPTGVFMNPLKAPLIWDSFWTAHDKAVLLTKGDDSTAKVEELTSECFRRNIFKRLCWIGFGRRIKFTWER